MAVVITNILASGGVIASGTQITTASFTAPLYRLILFGVGLDDSGTTHGSFSLSGLGMTWTSIHKQEGGISENEGRPVQLFRGVGNGQTGAVTMTFSESLTTCPVEWTVNYLNNVKMSNNGADAIVQVDGKGEGNPNVKSTVVTLGSFSDSRNATFGFAMINGSNDMWGGSGFTQISEDVTSNKRMHCQFKNSNDTTIDWGSQDDQAWSSIACELAFGSDINASPFIYHLI